jgi:hypothetical protein
MRIAGKNPAKCSYYDERTLLRIGDRPAAERPRRSVPGVGFRVTPGVGLRQVASCRTTSGDLRSATTRRLSTSPSCISRLATTAHEPN